MRRRAVGQEPEPRRPPTRHLDDGLEPTVEVDGVDGLAVHVREPEAVAPPARALAEHQPVDEPRRGRNRHGGTVMVALCAASRPPVDEEAE